MTDPRHPVAAARERRAADTDQHDRWSVGRRTLDQRVWRPCRRCGVLAVPHDRREHVLHDAPFGHRRVRVRWRKRVWRCPEPVCPVVTLTETHELAAPRALLTRRAVLWAADALSD